VGLTSKQISNLAKSGQGRHSSFAFVHSVTSLDLGVKGSATDSCTSSPSFDSRVLGSFVGSPVGAGIVEFHLFSFFPFGHLSSLLLRANRVAIFLGFYLTTVFGQHANTQQAEIHSNHSTQNARLLAAPLSKPAEYLTCSGSFGGHCLGHRLSGIPLGIG